MKLDFLKKAVDNFSDYEDLLSQGKQIVNQVKNKNLKGGIMSAVSLGKTLLEKSKSLKSESEGESDEETVEECQPEAYLPEEITPKEIGKGEVILSENMTKEEEDRFIENQRFNLMNASDVTSALTTLSSEVCETIKFCEIQQTKREKIRADANVRIAQINAITDSIKDYLNRSFDERSKVFDNYFNVLDTAIEKGDMNLMASTLQSINSLAASSPFKDLNDLSKVSQCLSEGGEWDI